MLTKIVAWCFLSVGSLAICSFYTTEGSGGYMEEPERQQAAKFFQEGNFRDALKIYQKLTENPQTEDRLLASDFNQAVACWTQLQRTDELDAYREKVIQIHPQKWRFQRDAAKSYLQGEHYGFVIAGEFYRGQSRGGGQWSNSNNRDRVRSLQILTTVMPFANANSEPQELAEFYRVLSQAVEMGRVDGEAWKLQILTDIATLPDVEVADNFGGWEGGGGGRGWGGGWGGQSIKGAPVDKDGNPIFYSIATDWQTAENDGQRWRWAMEKAATLDRATYRDAVDLTFAQFQMSQFDVQTMAAYGGLFRSDDEGEDDANKPQAAGPFAVSSLTENETLARLATGIKRFQLPDEFNHIRLFQQLARRESTSTKFAANSTLAAIFENRQQYPRAAQYWRAAIANQADASAQQRLDQIIKPWGTFETAATQPAGSGAKVEFRFRNGRQVGLTAKKINLDKLLADVKAHINSKPENIDWNRIQLEAVGYSILQENMDQYIGEQVANWQLELEPRADHFDRRITITTPLQKSGAYLVTAKMPDGNTSNIVLWVADTAIIRKQLDNRWLYMIVDAESGQPVPQCNVEFFGWKSQWDDRQKRSITTTKNFAEISDANGFIEPANRLLDQEHQWVTIARTPQGRLAFMGFNSVWAGAYPQQTLQEFKTYGITDRPIYRPGQTVKYNFWLRQVGYGDGIKQPWANKNVSLKLFDSQGQELSSEVRDTNQFAAVHGEWKLPADAPLGSYSMQISDPEQRQFGGSINFRVEEYKKPEFEVKVTAPDKLTRLGDSIPVKIQADYFFGGAVTKGVVKYKVHRTAKNQRWFPIGPWDWLYGNGYRWLGSDYAWYPGFKQWGCLCPTPPWWGYNSDPPELVLDEEGQLSADGSLDFIIDTALAKELHGDQDHEYSITVEVVDASRRTIVGSGNVIVTRKPFQVYVWTNRGYSRVGDPIEVSARARTADGQGVAGKGKLVLYRVVYDAAGKPTETELQTWDVTADENGDVQTTIKATEAGQYRLAVSITDANAQTITGGQLLHVVGDGFDSANFRYNDLEVLVEKTEYAPNEKVKLLLQSNRAGARLLVWVRPAGVYAGLPQVIQLEGKSTTIELDVTRSDMPNFFVEVTTVFGAKVHEVTKEIFVPPVSKVVKIELQPAATKVLPGQEATVKIKLTGADGTPFSGPIVMTMYDRALEYISGGSNVPDVREHFWNWKRSHQPSTEHTLSRITNNMVRDYLDQMAFLGVFGNISADVGGTRGLKSESAMAFGSAAPGGGGRGHAATMMGDAAGMPAPMAAAMEKSSGGEGAKNGSGGPPPNLVAPVVRTDFADAAFWSVDLQADSEGIAEATIKMPENLTAWKIRTWAMGPDTSVGEATTEIVTAKNIMVRLQAPRFFVEKDEVLLSAIVHNYLDVAKQADVSLQIDGAQMETSDPMTQQVELPAGGEKRVNWKVKVKQEGDTKITMSALTDVESDAMQMTFPVLVHGMLKTESFSGIVRTTEKSTKFNVRVPAERRPELSRLEVRYSPTLAGAMVDALPYMNDFPYGCTEQTLNRFLPTVITLNVLKKMNLDLKAIQEKRTNLNAQEIGDDVERAKRWKQLVGHNPVFDEAEVLLMAKQGVADLTKMQNSDGGWGWFSGFGEQSWPHTTAVVVHGLQIAKANQIGIVPGVLENGVVWLKRYQDEQVALLLEGDRRKDPPADKAKPLPRFRTTADNLDALVYQTLVESGTFDAAMADYLYRDRQNLSLYGMSLVGLAFDLQKDLERRDMLIRNIDQFVKYDAENQSAFIDLPNQNYWWNWYGDSIEANAIFLKLLSRTKPNDKVSAGLVKYLLNNRRHATYWNNTRDTALCVEAFAEFMQATGEDNPDMTVEIVIDGTVRQTTSITRAELFQFNNRFVLEGADLVDGEHVVEIRRSGNGNLYANAYLTNFTLEDNITAAGLEIKVQRAYYRLEQLKDAEVKVAGQRGQVVDQQVEKYKRVPLSSLDQVNSGDLIEIELEIDSKNDYEYVIFEDLKAAGCEPVELRSGYVPGSLNAYVEFRDQRVAFFTRTLARGKHSFSYRMRAETPGQFSALPTKAWAMYAPELKANSDEMKLKIADRKDLED